MSVFPCIKILTEMKIKMTPDTDLQPHLHTCERTHLYYRVGIMYKKFPARVTGVQKRKERWPWNTGLRPMWSLRTLSAHRKKGARNANLRGPGGPSISHKDKP